MEKPPIIDERLREVGRGAVSKIARRMGYLKLFTYGSAIGLGVYFTLVHEHRHPMTGKPYEHVFSPLRRYFWRAVDSAIGVDDEHEDDTGSEQSVQGLPETKIEQPIVGGIVKDIRFTPKELKQMKERGMTVPEIQEVSRARYEKFLSNVKAAKEARRVSNGDSRTSQ